MPVPSQTAAEGASLMLKSGILGAFPKLGRWEASSGLRGSGFRALVIEGRVLPEAPWKAAEWTLFWESRF